MNWTRVAGRKSPGATGCVATLHFLLYAARIHRLTLLQKTSYHCKTSKEKST
jgi:hypothetical protein